MNLVEKVKTPVRLRGKRRAKGKVLVETGVKAPRVFSFEYY